MNNVAPSSVSTAVRDYAQNTYVNPALRRRERTFSINVGEVHKAVALRNRVPLVCQALQSEKFLQANALRLVSKTGPPSGQSTTVTYTYEFIDADRSSAPADDSWKRLRGALKDVFKDLGGGEAYLSAERSAFYKRADNK
ncbi:MAG: hypothetical protein WCC32_14055 [Terriglobales bacterium]